jgi:carbamoyl-phosphate synthase large subunit
MKLMNHNILVTGCGGDIGQSIGKILNKYKPNFIMGCDISDKNAGKFIFPNFLKSVRCDDVTYINFIESIVEKNNIDLLIPVSEPELRVLTKKNILENIGKAILICPNFKAMDIGFDKLKTAQFLEVNNFPFPKTELINNINSVSSFPKIIKSRTGAGSSTVFIAKDEVDFNYLKLKHPNFIIQEYLSSNEGEFTCGVFRSKKGLIRTIQLKRELTGGYSGYGEVVDNLEIERLLIDIANKLDLVGSINVQLRLTDKGPMVFEINPRFSSTVFFRHLFGFNDLIWSIQDKTNQPIENYEKVQVGKKFYKGFSEYIN